MTFVVASEKELVDKVFEKISDKIKPGVVFGLTGDLGAGKTALVRGVAKKLGIKTGVTSPTFIFMKEYDGLRHIDFYRFGKRSKADCGEISDWLDNPKGPIFIEWPEKVPEVQERVEMQINLRDIGENKREVEILWK